VFLVCVFKLIQTIPNIYKFLPLVPFKRFLEEIKSELRVGGILGAIVYKSLFF